MKNLFHLAQLCRATARVLEHDTECIRNGQLEKLRLVPAVKAGGLGRGASKEQAEALLQEAAAFLRQKPAGATADLQELSLAAEKLRKAAQRNAAALAGALEGLRNGQEKIRERRDSVLAVSAYDAHGRRTQSCPQRHRHLKRV